MSGADEWAFFCHSERGEKSRMLNIGQSFVAGN